MSKPVVFVSSTYVDLKHVREHVSAFIEEQGFLPRLFEKGGIGFDFSKPIDESCYEAVADSDIFVLILGGRYGAPASGEHRKSIGKYNSITKKEYLEARRSNIPIYIFVSKEVLSEHRTYSHNKKNKSIEYAFVDSPQIFDVIDDIYSQNMNNYIYTYNEMQDISEVLKTQWASLLRTSIRQKKSSIKRNTAKLNSLKLFYFRRVKGFSQRELARQAGVNRQTISQLEKMRFSKSKQFEGYSTKYFPECEYALIARLEKALDCPGKLTAGAYDDFQSMYVEYYVQHRGSAVSKIAARHPLFGFETKAVVFDFDGTITLPEDGLTTWECIWKELGYSVNECAKYHSMFQKKEISHEEWCAITLEKFNARNFSRATLSKIASQTKLVPNYREVVQELHNGGKKLYVLSGSIKELIVEVIGDEVRGLFEDIKANEMRFSSDGALNKILGTRYDFWGKGDFLKQVVSENRCSPMEVLYIGNAGNDRWASNAGIQTLCVNPTSTDPDNPKTWTHAIRRMEDMREILEFVR